MKKFIFIATLAFGIFVTCHAQAGLNYQTRNYWQSVILLIATLVGLGFTAHYVWQKYKQQKKERAEANAHNENLLRDMLASSLPPLPRPSFIPDPNDSNLMRYVPLNSIPLDLHEEEKTPIYSISPLANSESNMVSKTVDNIPVVNFEDEPTQPDLQIEELARMSIHPKSKL